MEGMKYFHFTGPIPKYDDKPSSLFGGQRKESNVTERAM